MSTAAGYTYQVAAGAVVYGGVANPSSGGSSTTGVPYETVFASAAFEYQSSPAHSPTGGEMVLVQLHGSGGDPRSGGDVYRAQLVAGESYQQNNFFQWATRREAPAPVSVGGATLVTHSINPHDYIGGLPNASGDGNRGESFWLGWTNGPDANKLRLYTEHRLDAMLNKWERDNPSYSKTRRVLRGNSMGAWGSVTYGIRRAHMFSAIYAGAPRWRCGDLATRIWLMSWLQTFSPTVYPINASPLLVDSDGGGTSADHLNLIPFVANTANDVPWIGWNIGRQDGYMPFQDHVDAIAALRSAKRGFAVAWNDGNHGGAPSLDTTIVSSYPMGLFEIGKGYPLFTDHSLDANPAVDLAGGINIGLTFRNVVESAGAWSCQVTNINSACTVKVEPKSKVFVTAVAKQTVNIPSPGAWVSVSF